MLSATRVGPKNETPAIEAKRFVAPAETADAGPGLATLQPLAPASTPGSSAQANQNRRAPVQIAKADAPPRIRSSVKKLPQTASELPLTLLLALVCFFAAASLRLTRAHS
jgi:hypothetical protein